MTPNDTRPEMTFQTRDGVRLAHVDVGADVQGQPPLVLINGWTGDHGIFTPQIAHFSRTRRVVAVDLRGHGASDAPVQAYTVRGFAEDVAWQCHQLGIDRPVVIGHSFGGASASNCAAVTPNSPLG
ncbi:MAG: alpha/beta fold hydrolase [Janthinobacterium lividum]